MLEVLRSTLNEIKGRSDKVLTQLELSVAANLTLFSLAEALDLDSDTKEKLIAQDSVWPPYWEACLTELYSQGITLRHQSELDPLSKLVLLSIVDGLLAPEKSETQITTPQTNIPYQDKLIRREITKSSGDKVSYFELGRNQPSLLIINAVGVSLAPWARLIQDDEFTHNLIFWQYNQEATHGGLTKFHSIEHYIEDINAIISALDVEQIDILSWCSGCRVSLPLSACIPEKINRHIMLSPTLQGVAGCENHTSQYETNLNNFLQAVYKTPSIAPQVCHMLKQSSLNEFDPSILRALEPMQRTTGAEKLLALPAKEHTAIYTEVFHEPNSLNQYAHFIENVKEQNISSDIKQSKANHYAIMGSHDTSVNNQATLTAFKEKPLSYFTVFGASHYLQYQQYDLFKRIVSFILKGDTQPLCLSRVSGNW